MPLILCDVYGSGEDVDGCLHARLALFPAAAANLLRLRPLAAAGEKALAHKFLRVEALDVLGVEFGDAEGTCLADGGQWYAVDATDPWTPCPDQDLVVVRFDRDGVTWRMVPKYGEASPVTATLAWGELESAAGGKNPFPEV